MPKQHKMPRREFIKTISAASFAVLAPGFKSHAQAPEKQNSASVAIKRNVDVSPEFADTGNFIGKITSGRTDHYFPVNMEFLKQENGAVTVEFIARNSTDAECGILEAHVQKFGIKSTGKPHIDYITGHIAGHGQNAGDMENIANYAQIRWLRENRQEDYKRLVEQNPEIQKFGMTMRAAVNHYDKLFEGYHVTYMRLISLETKNEHDGHDHHDHDEHGHRPD